MKALRIGTRGSPLAMWQATWVADRLRALHPELAVVIETIRTSAELFPEEKPEAIGVGIFTKQIDEALLERRVDLAVHSLKDVPSQTHPLLAFAAIPERESPFDAFLAADSDSPQLFHLPPGAVIGTGSPRRRAQILERRPDLRVEPLRGNVDTRIRKAREGGMAGTILACAGLKRLGKEAMIRNVLSVAEVVPAVGQGALGIMARADREEVLALAAPLDHRPSRLRVQAERAFLATLRGGCQVPAGALAEFTTGETITLTAVLAATDGSICLRESASAPSCEGEALGRKIAQRLLDRGGAKLLELARGGANGGR